MERIKANSLIGHREGLVDSGMHTLMRLKAELLKKVIYCKEAHVALLFLDSV